MKDLKWMAALVLAILLMQIAWTCEHSYDSAQKDYSKDSILESEPTRDRNFSSEPVADINELIVDETDENSKIELIEQPYKIAFFGDIQGYLLSQYERFAQVHQIALEQMPDVNKTLIAGDIVDNGDSAEQWQYFTQTMGWLVNEDTLLTAIGNHDVYGSDEMYMDTFEYPDNGPEGMKDRCYYVDLPYGRLAVMDTENYSSYDVQKQWLAEIMAEVEGYKLVMMHRSVYPISYDEAHVRSFAQVFEDVGVDLVLSGHDHIYSRTAVKGGMKTVPGTGVTYIVGGSGSGSKYYSDAGETHRYWRDVVFDQDNPVYVLIEMDTESLNVEAYAVVDEESLMVDSFQLSK